MLWKTDSRLCARRGQNMKPWQKRTALHISIATTKGLYLTMASIQMEQQKLQFLLRRWGTGEIESVAMNVNFLYMVFNSNSKLLCFRRTHLPDLTENCNGGETLLSECGTTTNQQPRPPFAVLVQNFHSVSSLPVQHHVGSTKEVSNDGKCLRKKIPC